MSMELYYSFFVLETKDFEDNVITQSLGLVG